MKRDIYRYTFKPEIPVQQIGDSLFLAVFASEGLHGRAQVRLDAAFFLDEKNRTCVVDATTPVGQSIAQIFTGFLAREFGEDAFTVERVLSDEPVARPENLHPAGVDR